MSTHTNLHTHKHAHTYRKYNYHNAHLKPSNNNSFTKIESSIMIKSNEVWIYAKREILINLYCFAVLLQLQKLQHICIHMQRYTYTYMYIIIHACKVLYRWIALHCIRIRIRHIQVQFESVIYLFINFIQINLYCRRIIIIIEIFQNEN